MAGGASSSCGPSCGRAAVCEAPACPLCRSRALAFCTRERSVSCTCSGEQRARRSDRVRASRHAVARLLNAAQPLPPANMGKGPLEVRAGRACACTMRDSLRCPQIFKFSVYVTIPVLLTVAFAASPQNLQAIITNVRARLTALRRLARTRRRRASDAATTWPCAAGLRGLPHRGAAPAKRRRDTEVAAALTRCCAEPWRGSAHRGLRARSTAATREQRNAL